MRRFLALWCFFLLAVSSTAQTFYFTFEGIERSYTRYLPADYTPDSLYPLVFNLHGFGSNAIEQQLYSGFNLVADTAGVIVVYPNGVDNEWNVYSSGGINDVGFISALIDTMVAHYSVDLGRVYSTGMSMGGFMSYRLACELETRIAAIASVTGLSVANPCEPSRPVPILQMHGTADPVVPYAGVPLTISYWTEHNNCPADPVVTDLPDIDTTDNCTVTVSYYGLCDDSSEVILYTINGGEHTWPGALINIGVTNRDINGSVEIWNFFKKYSIDGSVGMTERNDAGYGLSFYPNPFREATTLEILGPYAQEYSLRIYDVNGKLVRNTILSGEKRLLVSRDGLTPGVYFVELTGNNLTGRTKLIVQ